MRQTTRQRPNTSRITRRQAVRLLGATAGICLGASVHAHRALAVAQGEAPADLKTTFEGTWELVEWHVDGRVLRPPEIGGRWSNNHGVVVANFHRQSDDAFESFVGYGTYDFDSTNWSYTYERTQVASGRSVEEATVAVRAGAPRRFKITRNGTKVILEGTNDRREYIDGFFLYMPNGRLLRKYKKVN